MSPPQKTLIGIASVSRRIANTLVKDSSRKTVESFQLDKVVVGSGAVLATLNEALLLADRIIDDRLKDWLESKEPQMCLDILSRMEALLCAKHSYGIGNFFRPPHRTPAKDNSREVIRLFHKHKDCFHFLLTTEIWNRESNAQQKQSALQPAVAMRTPRAVDNQDIIQAMQYGNEDTSSIAQRRERRKQRINMKKLNSVLKWINGLKCGKTHERLVLLRQPDTCTWLPNTSVYKAWRATDSSFLWLHGKAGAGKSILAASIIEGLKSTLQDGEALVLFYCDFRNEQSTSATEVMRSVLSQLLQQFCHHTIGPEDLVEELFKEKDGPTSVVSNPVLLARYISRAAKQFSRQPYLVIDALDECTDVEGLLDALLELNKGGVKLFVTSRPLQVIRDSLSGLPSVSMNTMKHAVYTDIRLHITRELDSHRRLRTMDTSLQSEIYSALCKQADGMFRWVECQLNVLKRCVTAVRVREVLNDLPADLNATYERILLGVSRDEHEGKVARRALDWLVAALEPLRLSQIMEGLSIDLKERAFNCDFGPVHGPALLDVLGSLVTYNEVTDIVILSHFSVKEYLTKEPTRPQQSLYHVEQQDAHEKLAQLCMCYIGVYLRQSSSHDAHRPRVSRDVAMFRSAGRRQSSHESQPLLEYVISHGLRHLAYIKPKNNSILKAIEALQSDAQQYPVEWERFWERAFPVCILWPALKHDMMLYILISVAPEPLFCSFIGSTKLKLKDGTNPLVYAAYFDKIEHARTLLSRGINLNRRGWHVDGYDWVLPIQVPTTHGAWNLDMVNLFITEGSLVPHKLFVELLNTSCEIPGHIVSRLLQTDDFLEWAINTRDQELLLRALDVMRYLNSCPSEQEVEAIERRLVQVGCDTPFRFNETSLRQAVSVGHVSTVKHTLTQNILLPPDIILDASRSMNSNAAMIRLLLGIGSSVNVSTSHGDTPLHLVMTCGLPEDECLDSVQVLVDAGCNLSTKNLADNVPLHLAVMHGYTSVVEYLLSSRAPLPPDILLKGLETLRTPILRLLVHNGVDVHALAANGDNPLHLVLDGFWFDFDECLECAKILIGAGCDPFSFNALGETPFDIAAWNGHFHAMEYLLSLDLPLPSLLFVAGSSWPEATSTIKLLIDKGADIHVTSSTGDTLLHLSMNAGLEVDCLRRVITLVNAGCNPCACNAAGDTPFHLAAERRYISVMEFLLSLGISIPSDIMATQFVQHPYFNPLRYCPTVRFLWEKGGDIHTVVESGDNLLHRATGFIPEPYALELVEFLVPAGCSPLVHNIANETPLHMAAQRGYITVINYFLSLDIPLPPDILLAASKGHSQKTQLICYLIDKGASVSVTSTNGDSPLHLLLAEGEEYDRLVCVRTLADAGCDLLARNLAGETPLHSAARHGFTVILEYFLSQGIPLPHDILLVSGPITVHFLLRKGIAPASDGGPELMHRILDTVNEKDSLDCARVLMSLGWDTSLRNSAGETVMHVAARNGLIDTLHYLLSQNVPVPSDILLTVMQSSVCQSDCLVVSLTRLLFHGGASITAVTSNGDTPLHLALKWHFVGDRFRQQCSWDLVQMLLDGGSDPYAQNADGETPFDLAEAKGDFFGDNFSQLVESSCVQHPCS